jgi:hypothetical protein
MFSGLAEVHRAFALWNRKAYSRAAADKLFCAMPPRIEELMDIFAKGRRYKDIPREPWPERGYSITAWNGRDGPCGVSVNINAGSYAVHNREL